MNGYDRRGLQGLRLFCVGRPDGHGGTGRPGSCRV